MGSRIYQDTAKQIEVWIRPLAPLATCDMSARHEQTVAGVGWGHTGEDEEGLEALKCQPRAALVFLNRSPRAQKMQVTIQALTQSSGLESWKTGISYWPGFFD